MQGWLCALSHTISQDGETSSQGKKPSGSRSIRSQKPREEITPAAHYHVPATVSASKLLDRGSDRQFRGLIQDLLTVARRLEMARDYFGRLINVTGPQYHLLMTVAQLQGALGVSVGTVAQVMHVSSAFVTSETGKLSSLGLLRKRPNPLDRRGALLSLTQAGRLKMDRLIPEIRAVNDRFFGRLDAHSFSELCASAVALVHGSREAMRYTQRAEDETS
jgi:MarR family transcriptional regulator, organic hydroperoxide resistance regulator